VAVSQFVFPLDLLDHVLYNAHNMSIDGRFYDLQNREQPRFFAPSLRQQVEQEPDVLALDAAVQRLDLSELEARYSRVGHPAYPPRAMLKVLLYGYSLGMRSSRHLERACRMDRAFQFLAHGLQPDFRTLCRFRRRHADLLKGLFAQTVRMCQEAGLVSLGHVAVDGTKVRANRSGDALAKAKEALRDALAEAEEADADIPEDEQAAEGADAECEFMKMPEGLTPSYNGQVAVDGEHQVIVGQDLSATPHDQGQLPGMVEQVRENCRASPPTGRTRAWSRLIRMRRGCTCRRCGAGRACMSGWRSEGRTGVRRAIG